MPKPKISSHSNRTSPPQGSLTNRFGRQNTKINLANVIKIPQRQQSDDGKSKSQAALTNVVRKCPQPTQVRSSCSADPCKRKPSINTEIRRVAPKSTTYGPPYSSRNQSTKSKPEQNDVKPVDGRRPVLKMPASIPKAGRRNRYVITVVGNEIKLLEPKDKLHRSDTSRLQVSIRAEKLKIPKRRRKKGKTDVVNLKKEVDDKRSKETRQPNEGSKSVVSIVPRNYLENSDSCDLDPTVARLNLSGNEKKFGKFSDRRTKAEVGKPVGLTTDAALLDKLDPISNILATEYVDSVQRCPGIPDFLTEPTENPNPPFPSKKIFYDSTMMEEMNFPPLLSSDLQPDIVELPLVPRYFPDGLVRTISWPMMSPLKPEVRRHNLSRKKRPKLETILATRPKGFHHAKWLEKTVASDSQLKTRLLRDVIVSQVKKLLKRQAELRSKVGEKQPDAVDGDSKAASPNT